MSDFDLVLSGRVILTDREVEGGFVAVRDGKVALVGEGAAPRARERHDLGPALILPGAVDAQVHSLSQKGAEGFAASTAAAAAGGVTTIVDMPYDEGDLIASAAAVGRKAATTEADARVDVALYGTIDPDEGSARIAEQAEAGVCAFKFSTFGTDAKRFPRIPPALLMACFAEVAKTGLAAGVHNEDDADGRALARQLMVAVDLYGARHRWIVSGAGHDAAFVAKIAPRIMIFVSSRDGRSHCPEEFSTTSSIGLGAEILAEAVIEFDREEGN